MGFDPAVLRSGVRSCQSTSTQEDPIGLAGGMNLYGYGAGDPINNSDPFGLSTCPPDCPEGDGLTGEQAATVLEGLRDLAPGMKQGLVDFIVGNVIAAIGGAAVEIGVASIASKTTTFYRGVSAAEAADIQALGGQLRAGAAASGNVGKYLTNSAGAAGKWAAQNGPGSVVMKVEVPADAVRRFTYLGRIDGIGEAWHAPMSALRGARATPLTESLPALSFTP